MENVQTSKPERTVREWLERLTTTNTSTEEDSLIMQGVLHKLGMPKARCVLGAVYPDGYGQPVSIHQMAKIILEATK